MWVRVYMCVGVGGGLSVCMCVECMWGGGSIVGQEGMRVRVRSYGVHIRGEVGTKGEEGETV